MKTKIKKIEEVEFLTPTSTTWCWKDEREYDPIYGEKTEQKINMLKDKLNEIIDRLNHEN